MFRLLVPSMSLITSAFGQCITDDLGFTVNEFTLVTTATSWTDANTACINMGQQLAVVTNQDDNDNLLNVISSDTSCNQYYWFGLEDTDNDGVYQWVDQSSDLGSFPDNTDGYTNWAPNRPDFNRGNLGSSPYCGLINRADGTWDDSTCTDSGRCFVCQCVPDPTNAPSTVPTQQPTPDCSLTGSEYTLVDQALSYDDAEATCNSLGQQLAVIRNQNDNDAVFNAIQNSPCSRFHWIGLEDRDNDLIHSWIDGSGNLGVDNLDGYTNWYPGRPDFDGNNPVCGLINEDDGTWDDHDCDFPTRCFVCQCPPEPTEAPTREPTEEPTYAPTTPPDCDCEDIGNDRVRCRIGVIQSASIAESFPNINFGNYGRNALGRHPRTLLRTLIEFDDVDRCPAFTSNICNVDSIFEAVIYMQFTNRAPGQNSGSTRPLLLHNINSYQLLKEWDEFTVTATSTGSSGVNWDTVNIGITGNDALSTAAGEPTTFIPSFNGLWLELDVINAVKNWINGDDNNGLLIKVDDETTVSRVLYFASETTGDDFGEPVMYLYCDKLNV